MGSLKLAVAALAALLSIVPQAGAQTRSITYAARSCPSYADVTANLARNNIQESLQDLGPDTDYVSGEPISPAVEEPGQPNCSPIVGWRFVLGDGIASSPSVGPWGSLSQVSDPDGTEIVTQAAVPLRNANGDATGGSLRGAVTVELTDAQAERASRTALWVQGGVIDDPVLTTPYPGQYGFAALRCAVDNLNGDNVESPTFPQGARHVYCYAYYVTPPPTSGTIVVRKVVDDPEVTSNQDFRFTGNISYTTDHSFTLSARDGQPASQTFFRAATGPTVPPWTFTEEVPPGWSLTGIECVSATGTSSAATDAATGTTAVTLGAGDTVTCTYTNRHTPPQAGLLLVKRTLGGVGRFRFDIDGPDSGRQTLTTTRAGVPVAGAPLAGSPGEYEISEARPRRSAEGRWTPTRAACNGRASNPLRPVALELGAGVGAVCEFTNRFIPAGRLRINKVTIGGTATARYQIAAVRNPDRVYLQAAAVRRPLVPRRATGDDTTALPLGSYAIVESGQRVTRDGHWRLDAVLCDGRPVAAAQGRIRVRLTAADPAKNCTFFNSFHERPEPPNPNPGPGPAPTPTPAPPAPPAPTPTPPPATPADFDNASGPNADLVVTKRVSPRSARPGQRVTYTVTVTNRGPDIAYDVVVAELQPRRTERLSLRPSQGRCQGDRPARCALGTLDVGERATITVTVAAGAPGRSVNRVAAASSTGDPVLADNVAAAALTVLRPARPRYTG